MNATSSKISTGSNILEVVHADHIDDGARDREEMELLAKDLENDGIREEIRQYGRILLG